MENKPDEKRIIIRRKYRNVYQRLRKIFNIPDNEMILSFEWDKNEGELILKTLKDEAQKHGDN